VQVLHQQHQQILFAPPGRDPAEEVEDPSHADIRGERRGRVVGIGGAEEVDQQRDVGVELRIEGAEVLGHPGPDGGAGVKLADLEIVAEQGEDGQEWHGAAVGDAGGAADDGARPADFGDELVAEPALAPTGLGDHADDLSPAARGAVQLLAEHR
jgi:hypothetical protein